MPEDDYIEDLTFATDEPDIAYLKQSYEQTQNGLSQFFLQCADNYNDRRNEWPGKSKDHRKNAADAFPWKGASDVEAHVIDERINTLVAMCVNALNRANIRAFPVETGDIARARVVSNFLKWMAHSYIPRFKQEMEAGANSLFENGIVFTHIGWEQETRTRKRILSLEQIAAVAPRLAADVMEGESETLVEQLIAAYPAMTKKRAKRAVNDLRKTGTAEIMVSEQGVNRPTVRNARPEGEWFFPSYVTDPQDAPYGFYREFLTPQEIWQRVDNDGWDADWADYVIKNARANDTDTTYGNDQNYGQYGYNYGESFADDLVEVVWNYQRLIDPDDNSQGIYCTVTERSYCEKAGESVPGYAIHYLLNGFDDYPVVCSRLDESTRRFYDSESICEMLRGIQWTVKVERDSRIDRNSLATVPPLLHPPGKAPADWGPARRVPRLRQGDIEFGPTPPYNADASIVEKQMLELADEMVGLNHENPLSRVKQQFFVDKFLQHVEKVLQATYKAFMRFGPEDIWFQVTGVPEPQKFQKGGMDESYNIMIGFDVLNTDPDAQEKKLQQLVSLMQFDRNGRMDPDTLLDVLAGAVDPALADAVLKPAEEAADRIKKDVTDDLSKIYAGIEQPARPNGARAAIKLIEQYVQQEDLMAKMQQDEAFAERIKKYYDQYQFQEDQAQNAQIGKIGTAPAAMGGVSTQDM